MGDLYSWSLQDHGSIALFQSERGGPEQPLERHGLGFTLPTAASQKPGQLRGAPRGGPVAVVSQISLGRCRAGLLIRSAAEGCGCAARPPAPRSWWSSSWGSCWWCPSTSSCTGAAAKSTQKGLKQLCCKLSTWKWSPSGSWCGPRRIIQRVWGKREGERVNVRNYINPNQTHKLLLGSCNKTKEKKALLVKMCVLSSSYKF